MATAAVCHRTIPITDASVKSVFPAPAPKLTYRQVTGAGRVPSTFGLRLANRSACCVVSSIDRILAVTTEERPMIEIAVLAFVMNKVVKLCDERGRSWKPLAALLLVLWFGLEIPVLVLLISGGASTLTAFAGGIAAALLGAGITLVLAARPASANRPGALRSWSEGS
ncbi:MAG: hypothetical protein AB7W59_03990 [Acidimicrobiia bacterium]